MSEQLSGSSINTQPCNAIWTPESKKDVGKLARVQGNGRQNNVRNKVSEKPNVVSTVCPQKRRLKTVVEVFWGGPL